MNISSLIEDRGYEVEANQIKNNQETNTFEPIFQTFTVKCEKKLSSQIKSVLKTWKGKAFYYVNEDLLYLFKSHSTEQDFFLKILHSMAIFLQNGISASFFDIYIYDVKITKIPKFKKKSGLDTKTIGTIDYITFILKCSVTFPSEKPEIHW
uniref:Uncharacterized protein n=1 Tax=Pseudictyota dubia TaxID=2749911 RepID=A0A2U9NQZ6_9STRA|nr:hypothetical protein ycf88 [Pseudictyota dubia]AWT39557.1 hypothetical protein ycf88 [Pseudictyota dubia]